MPNKSAQPPKACSNQRCRAFWGSKEEVWASREAGRKGQNYMIKFHLCPGAIKDPEVIRTLSCPAWATFEQLHEALQIAFGWAGGHLYDFNVPDHKYSDPEAEAERRFLFRIDTPYEYPPVYPDAIHINQRLHDDTLVKDSDRYTLYNFVENARLQDYLEGYQMRYTYDFADNWEHVMTWEGRAPLTTHFTCLSGEGHPAAKDSGGAVGWNELKQAYQTITPSRAQRQKRSLYEHHCRNRASKGLVGVQLWQWDRDQVNQRLSKLELF